MGVVKGNLLFPKHAGFLGCVLDNIDISMHQLLFLSFVSILPNAQ